MSTTCIFPNFRRDRLKIGVYCLKDAHLPSLLMDHLDALDTWIKGVQYICIEDLQLHGQ
ncbi:hypothetical protein BT96DRAFT_665786 [Gymnopus androsaceus JB14]|uniref:Uncharacterized protein n=1 Tax=Gymnopus androsaceus JB14 TaxID=1447944 RepID=A0A6A4IF52_9AGAR|nr:hypothetical protein BT96DRAFT_665786 [Gymnopus androsaceus JB14]